MKYIFLNDKTNNLRVHVGSIIMGGELLIPGQKIEVEIPDGKTPFIKVWDNMVLLSAAD